MDIYVGNIPKGTRPGEIKKLLKQAIKEKVFPRLFEKIVATGQIDKGVGIKIHKTKAVNGEQRVVPRKCGFMILKALAVAK